MKSQVEAEAGKESTAEAAEESEETVRGHLRV